MAIQVPKTLTGETTVIAFDTSARKLEIAKKLGATRHCSAATRLVTRTIVVIPLADDMHRAQHYSTVWLRHSNDRVTRKHYIKPPSIEAVSAMQRLSDTLPAMEKPQLLPNCSPEAQHGTNPSNVEVAAMRKKRT